MFTMIFGERIAIYAIISQSTIPHWGLCLTTRKTASSDDGGKEGDIWLTYIGLP